MTASTSSASFQDVAGSAVQPHGGQSNPAPQSLIVQIHQRFARFCDRYPHSSLTSTLESGPVVNGAGVTEYVVRATIRLEGCALVSSLAAAATIEEAEDRARLRSIALAEAITVGPAATSDLEGNISSNWNVLNGRNALDDRNVSNEPGAASDPVLNSHAAHDDGLGDTLINLGGLEATVEQDESSTVPVRKSNKKSKPKPKSKSKPGVGKSAESAKADLSEPAAMQPNPGGEAIATQLAPTAPEKFVADWSEDLAQIAIELKRLNWDGQQEQDYLQRTFGKSSRDDIVDHRELMDYLGYLQALPSHFEAATDEDETSIAEAGLSIDEADLAPQSVTELMASAGLKSGADISTPQPATTPTTAATNPSPISSRSSAPPESTLADAPVIREPEPEIEVSASEPDAPELSTDESSIKLSRSEMMEETARLCKLLGWKNRQGSDFLKATYNKPTRKDLTDSEMMDFLEQLRSLSTTEALPY